MKTKLTITIGMMTAALFVLVPSAAPKGHSGGGPGGGGVTVFTPQCSAVTGADTDMCTVTVAGLSSTLRYQLVVLDTGACGVGGIISTTNPTAGQLALGVIVLLNDTGCSGASFTFNLYSSSTTKGSFGSGTLVGTGTGPDIAE